MSKCATPEEALAFIRQHGVVLASAKGAAPRLTEAIVGEPIKGSWWAHSQSHHIYAILEAVTESEQVLVCRLINGKVHLLEWIGPEPRPYSEVLEAWRTSCPRLPVWEEANALGFLMHSHREDIGTVISVSSAGLAHVAAERGKAVSSPR